MALIPLRQLVSQISPFITDVRTKSLYINVFFGLLGRLINLASTFFAIPLALEALGKGDYGVLAVIISITTFFSYADFGLGSSLVNDVAMADSENDLARAKKSISQVWFLLCGIALAIIFVGMLLVSLDLLSVVLPISAGNQTQVVWMTLVAASALGIPLATSQRVFFALRLGGTAQSWTTAARIAVIIGAFVSSIYFRNLYAFAFSFVVMPPFVAALSTAYLFFLKRPDLKPDRSVIDATDMLVRLKDGLKYAFLNVCTFLEVGLDPYFNSLFFSSTIVAEVDLQLRIYMYVPALLSIALAPFWPAVASAQAGGDFKWAKNIIVAASIGVPIVASGSAFFLYANKEAILHWWLHRSIPVSGELSILIPIFSVLQSIGLFQLICLNALGGVRTSASVSFGILVLFLPLKIIALKNGTPASGYEVLLVWYLIKISVFSYAIKRLVDRVGKS